MGKYLDFYKKCMETGEISSPEGISGLCYSDIGKSELLEMFKPTAQEREDVFGCFYYTAYWATDNPTGFDEGRFFGPTRQNIVLLMAAMNDEL